MRVMAYLATTVILLEVSLRYLLFGGDPLARRLGAPIRKPSLYASLREREYYRLQQRLAPRPLARYHPELGWITASFSAELIHDDEASLGDRRPLLLFGDSFANCVTSDADCWQGLVERSSLGDEVALLNFGVGGFGTDQILMLCERVLPRFLDRDPIVAVGLLVDDDLDRAVLDIRGWPKPLFAVGPSGDLVRPTVPVPEDGQDLVTRQGVGIASYAWRYLVWGTRAKTLGPLRGETLARHFDRVRTLNSALLAELHHTLDAAGVEHFVVVFYGPRAIQPSGSVWAREEFLLAELERLGLPYVSTRLPLARALRAGERPADLYYLTGHLRNHLTARGNQVTFAAFLDGIEGRFHGLFAGSSSPGPGGTRTLSVELHGASPSVCLPVAGRVRELAARVRSSAGAEDARLVASSDGVPVLTWRVEDLAGERTVVALRGLQQFTLALEPAGVDGVVLDLELSGFPPLWEGRRR